LTNLINLEWRKITTEQFVAIINNIPKRLVQALQWNENQVYQN